MEASALSAEEGCREQEHLLVEREPLPPSRCRRGPWALGSLLCLCGVAGLACRPRGGRQWAPHRSKALAALSLASDAPVRPEDLGIVHELYTYGAPAATQPPLEDQQRPDGCFRGLRSYTEDIFGVANESHQVDAASMINTYDHPKMPVAALHWGYDSLYVPCPGKPHWPQQGAAVYQEWRLHWEEDYTPRLKHVRVHGKDYSNVYPFDKAYLFVILAYKSYDTTEHTKQAISVRMPGWRLVAKEVREQGTGTLYDRDPVMIVQDSHTLDCALVFTGTNNRGNELTSSTTSYATSYCGYDTVHAGYRNELWHITRSLWPALRPKLAKCGRVTCVGHSMGGPVCELFAACANSKRSGDPDFEQQMWVKGTPEAMPEV